VFEPEFARIKPGDTVTFIATYKGHEAHSLPGMIPEGAAAFDAGMNRDAQVTFTEPGLYVVRCTPHLVLGMVGLIVVGDPVNIDKIDPSALPLKARAKIQSLLKQIDKG
jgi:pseudoazurin